LGGEGDRRTRQPPASPHPWERRARQPTGAVHREGLRARSGSSPEPQGDHHPPPMRHVHRMENTRQLSPCLPEEQSTQDDRKFAGVLEARAKFFPPSSRLARPSGQSVGAQRSACIAATPVTPLGCRRLTSDLLKTNRGTTSVHRCRVVEEPTLENSRIVHPEPAKI